MPDVAVASLDLPLQKQVEKARLAFERGNYEYVSELCSTILQQAPACVAVRRLSRAAQVRRDRGGSRLTRVLGSVTAMPWALGASAQVKKDPRKAFETAEKLLGSNPHNAAALRTLAQAARALDWPETAAFACEAIRERAPTDMENLMALGEALLAAGKADEAVKIADAALRLHPAHADAQNLLRTASVATTVTQGNWEAGGSYRAKLKDEASAVSLEQSAKVTISEEMAVRLAAEARERVAREPDNLNHYRALVQAYRGLGQLEEALHWVHKARLRPVGAADPGLEKLESELRLATQEARVDKLEAGGGAALATARADLAGQRLAQAQALVDKQPNDHAARLALGELLTDAGRLDAAIAQFQVAQRNPKSRLAALLGLGRCFRLKKLHDLAIAQLSTAKAEVADMDATKMEIVYELGLSLEESGQMEQAMAEFKTIYAVDIGYRGVAAKIDAFYAAPAKRGEKAATKGE